MWSFLSILSLNILAISASNDRIHDLSWNFNNDTIYWIGQRQFSFTKQELINGDLYSYAANEFCAAEHGGTHLDAPYHFNLDAWKVSEIPLSRLFVKGAFIDLSKEHERLGRNSEISVKHLEDWEKRNGEFENGTVLLVKYGRSKYWPNKKEYFDIDDDGTLHFPGLSYEAAQWIANRDKFYGVGIDTPSVDGGNTTGYVVHSTLSKRSLYNLENVKLLIDLPEKGFDLIVAPMKIEGGTGAPVRVFAHLRK